MDRTRLVRRFRCALIVFIVGLVLSGLTAFPLLAELNLLAAALGIPAGADPAALTGLHHWIALVREGLARTHDAYPFLAYGTDWLAFGHLVIAVFFIGPLREPARHDWTLMSGIIACVGVIPLALICGSIRGIPLYWRLIDCSFGVVGIVPLLFCLGISRRLKGREFRDVAAD
jgi:hypothetical protein